MVSRSIKPFKSPRTNGEEPFGFSTPKFVSLNSKLLRLKMGLYVSVVAATRRAKAQMQPMHSEMANNSQGHPVSTAAPSTLTLNRM